MTMAKQASSMPTNKLAVGSVVATIVSTQLSPAIVELWPQVAPALLAGPAVAEIVSTLAALAAALLVGWFVPDRAQA